jgi:hypothetical protein
MFLKECANPFERETCGQVKFKSVQAGDNEWVAGGPRIKKADSVSAGGAGAIFYEESIAEIEYESSVNWAFQ